ncbi:RNase adapter RapZ [Arenibaculum pallidiluteum]|uniref:RNase adapter RapZ n=1 Tax=Arenibaculum pallidiluteum TaxID=2812559 RepID=UPI001A95825F|nr:RNase adapter RapZ [Arenibaculum pallidiluteum]
MTELPPEQPAGGPAGGHPGRPEGRRPVVLLTGLSGAGLSTALKALEDVGYEAVDNLPLSLLPALVPPGEAAGRPLALVVDSRTRAFTAAALTARLDELSARTDLWVRLVFLDCADEVLQRRFTETRRRHPQANDRPVMDGIRREREILWPLRLRADLTLDTSLLSTADLRRLVAGHLRLSADSPIHVFVTSFSFRLGVPREADLLFDVRFLDNPHYDPELRPLSGLDEPVARKVASDPDYPGFFTHLKDLLQPLLPRYAREGKSYLTIAVGCTGGRHRSVFVAARLAEWLGEQGYRVGLYHRDMERWRPGSGTA